MGNTKSLSLEEIVELLKEVIEKNWTTSYEARRKLLREFGGYLNYSYNFSNVDKLKEALILLVRATLVVYDSYHTYKIKHKLSEAITALNDIEQENSDKAELAYKVFLLIMIHLHKDNFCMLALKNGWNKNKYDKIFETIKQLFLEEISDDALPLTKEYIEEKLEEAGVNSNELQDLITAFETDRRYESIIEILNAKFTQGV